jgi:hypothetical protein
VTWTFDQAYTYGTFLNGDYWVVGDINVIHIDPCCSATEVGRTRNGSMFDPNAYELGVNNTTSKHGFDSGITGYDASLNMGLVSGANITSINYLNVPNGTSLVSCVSGAGATTTAVNQSILTVLVSEPDVNSFRPAYSAVTKVVDYNWADVNTAVLANLTEQAGFISWADVASGNHISVGDFTYPYIAITSNAPGGKLTGTNHSVHDDFTWAVYCIWLKLNCDYTLAEKKPALIEMIQLAIDLHGVLITGKGGYDVFHSDGAFNMGKKMAILAGFKMLNLNPAADTVVADVLAKSGDYGDTLIATGTWPEPNVPTDYYHFAEDDAIHTLISWDILDTPYPVFDSNVTADTGTVSVTNGSYYVVGSGTSFLDGKRNHFIPWADQSCCKTDINNVCDSGDTYGKSYGAWFIVDGDSEVNDPEGRPYEIADFNDDTHLTLMRPYEGATSSGESFEIATIIYYGHGSSSQSNYPNCYRGRDVNEVTDANLGWPVFQIGYLGGGQHTPTAQALDHRIASDVGNGYMVNVSRCLGGQMLVAYIMGLEWGHDPVPNYTDWYVTYATANGVTRFQDSFEANMWDTYRGDYGALYSGPAAAATPTYFLGIYTP